MEMIISIIAFVFVLTVLVMAHELGHFWVARKNKIKVEEFGLGLPPRIWGKKYNGTLYSINWLPFGGFVRLLGEDSEGADLKKKGSFYLAPAKTRAAVVVAGVVVNYFIAVILLYIVLIGSGFKFSVPQIVEHNFKFANNSTEVVLAEFTEESPLKVTGLEPGDVVKKINGSDVGSAEFLSNQIKNSTGTGLSLEIKKFDGELESIQVNTLEKDGKKILGVYLAEQTVISYDGFWQRTFSGVSQSINLAEYSTKVMGALIGSFSSALSFTPTNSIIATKIGNSATGEYFNL